MTAADLEGVEEIEMENPSPWSAESLARELEVDQGIRMVVEAGDAQLLGWCACRVLWPEAELLKIAVKKRNRRSGIGRALFDRLSDELRKRKITGLFIEVRSHNRPALDFYDKLGFSSIGSRPGYYTDPPDSATMMKKDFTINS